MTKDESLFRTNKEVVSEILGIVSATSKDVNDLKSDVRSIKQWHDGIEDWKHSHEGKVVAIETMVQSFQLEKAKLGVVSKFVGIASGFIGGIISGVVIGIFIYYITK